MNRSNAPMNSGLTVRARAPLRLGFGGGGTDVSPFADDHGGVILNATIDLFAYATIEPRDDGKVRLTAADGDVSWEGPVALDLGAEDPLRLLKGVYNRMIREFSPDRPLPLTLTTYADCPPGSGLGTSSALVVAMVEAFSRYIGVHMTRTQLARLAFDIERRDLNLAGGRQDQYAAAFGGVNLMQFGANESVNVDQLNPAPETLKELEASLVLYFTGVSRESAATIEDQIANMKSRSSKSQEGLQAMKSGALDMRDALMAGDLTRFGALLDAGWASKKDTAASVSSAQIDRVYAAAKAFGAFGGKVSGAGGGGFMMFLIDPTGREGLKRVLAQFGGQASSAKFFSGGVESWTVDSASRTPDGRRFISPAQNRVRTLIINRQGAAPGRG